LLPLPPSPPPPPPPIHRRAAGLLAAAWLASLPLAVCAAEPAVVTLQPAQARALGVVTTLLAAGGGSAAAAYPARVVVPPAQQRVVAAALPGLLQALTVAVGDSVRAGQVLGSVRSGQAQELQRDSQQADSQAALAAQTQARDEQLFREGLIAQARLDASRAAGQQAQALAQERRRAVAQAGAGASGGGLLTLVSPIAGTVLEVGATPGQRVDSGTALVRIAALGTLWLELQVSAADVAAVAPGQRVQVVGHDASGPVLRIAPAVDAATQTVTVRAALSGAAAAQVRPGQWLEARIDGLTASSGTPGALLVPAGAVLRHGGGTAVFVALPGGQYRLQPVQAQPAAGNRMALRGIAAGQPVVVEGTAALLALVKP